jgi:sulfatase maturation enzyme AslB (radical SAM superfamily)
MKNNSIYISTSGVPIRNPKVKECLKKWAARLQLQISLDGHPALHDKQRPLAAGTKVDGNPGSYAYIKEMIDWVKEEIPASNWWLKLTTAPSTYSELFESTRFVYEDLGIKNVGFNRSGQGRSDPDTKETFQVFYDQMIKILEYALKHPDLSVRYLNYYNGPFDQDRQGNYDCGFPLVPIL